MSSFFNPSTPNRPFPDDVRDGRRVSAQRDAGGQDGLALLAVLVRRDGEAVDRRHRLLQGRPEPPLGRRGHGAEAFEWEGKGFEVEIMLIVDPWSYGQ